MKKNTYDYNKNDYMNFYKYMIETEQVIEGCKDEEIEQMMHIQNKPLPKAYLNFLKYFGNDNRLLGGSDYQPKWFFEDGINGNAQLHYAIELLEENNNTDVKLTDNDFVFMMHQGYIFYVIKLDEGDNPPVYYYAEDVEPPQTELLKISESFSEFLIDLYNAYA